MANNITIHFPTKVAKGQFIRRNRELLPEITAEDRLSITVKDTGQSWESSLYVSQVTGGRYDKLAKKAAKAKPLLIS